MKKNILFIGSIGIILLGILNFSGCTVTVQPTPEPAGPAPSPSYYPPPRPVQMDIGFFYDELAPYGEWFLLKGHGYVWTPYNVPSEWRPYTVGRWVYTNHGWTWVSDFEWGWAPFHYGRWMFDPYYGWIWVPGREWAPAWVAWRSGRGWVGWAPLPPEADWQTGSNIDAYIKPFGWCFVSERLFIDSNLKNHLVLPARNKTFIRVTNNVTNYTVVQNRVINRSLTVDLIERGAQQPVPRYQIVDRESAPEARNRIRGNEVYMFRHRLAETAPNRVPPKAEPGRSPETRDQGRDVRTPPSERLSLPELSQRQESERRQLNTRHQEERAKLEEEHRGEMSRPPRRTSLRELQREHEAERRDLDEQQERERKLLEKRHEREHKGEGRYK